MIRSLLLAGLLAGCSLGPGPLLADGGSAEGDDTSCGSNTCTPTRFCVRRSGGVDGGGLSPDHCATAETTAPSCSDAWTNAACAPTPCRTVSAGAGGNFIDCWGQ